LQGPRKPYQDQPVPEGQWVHADISSFYGRYIRPCLISLGPARPVIERILDILDEHGDCPWSLSAGVRVDASDSDDERIFAGITLRDYSLHVARIAHDLLKKGHKSC
jgi:hypothetical protein